MSNKSRLAEMRAAMRYHSAAGGVPEVGTPCPRSGHVVSGLDAEGRMVMYGFREKRRDASALARSMASDAAVPCAVVEHITFPEDFRPNGADIVPVAYALAQHSGTPVEMWCHAG